MRKDRLYLYTFLAITIIFILIAGVAANYFVRASADQLLTVQLESGRREAREIASLASYQLESGLTKQTVTQNIQKSIQNTNPESLFVSVFDWSGREICHPDITKVGQKVPDNQSVLSTVDNEITTDDFYALLMRRQEAGSAPGSEAGEMDTETIYLYPVANSDWIVGVHANLKMISGQIDYLRNRFYVILAIMGFVTVLSSVVTVRILGSLYEKRLIAQKEKLEEEVINLAKLNKALDRYQQKVGEVQTKRELSEVQGNAAAAEQASSVNGSGIKDSDRAKTESQRASATENEPSKTDSVKPDTSKKRILTYLRHELLPVATNEIAYIYTENTITYVVDINGKRSTVNTSLDDLYSALDPNFFYRANRQFIIAISSIEKIIRFGKTKLKILMKPECELDIIIGKNNAAEFKQWLNI